MNNSHKQQATPPPPTVMVTTKIKRETYQEIKRQGLKMNHLIELGLRAYQDNPQLISRVAVLEERLDTVHRILDRHTQRLFVLEEERRELR